MNNEPKFLSRKHIDELHEKSLQQYGGSGGVRDDGLVESALASATNTYLYGRGDIFDIAAAYAYHLAEAQAFVDGNKRTAAGAALTFLEINRATHRVSDERFYDAMIAIANKQMNKAGLASLLRESSKL